MTAIIRIFFVLALILVGGKAMAIEEAPYQMVTSSGIFEVREYAPLILAEIMVDGDLEDAGNKAFRPLFIYISGANRSRSRIAMTAPVPRNHQGRRSV